MLKTFPFLASTRFWALVLIGLTMWLGSYGWLPRELVEFIYVVAGGHVGLRTIDKTAENVKKLLK